MVHLLAGHKYRDLLDSINETEFPISVDSYIITDSETMNVVGAVNIEVFDSSIYLQTIEVLPKYRLRGYARETINALFLLFPTADYISGVVFSDIVDFYKSLENCTLKPCLDPNVCSTDDMEIFKISRPDFY